MRSWRRRVGSRLGLRDKTLWDWLDLFIVPIVIAVLVLFVEQQLRSQQEQLETIRRQTAASQEFIDKIAELSLESSLLEESTSPKRAAAKSVAQARLELVLAQLDLERRLDLTEFLIDMELVQEGPGCGLRTVQGITERAIRLQGIDLAEAPGPNGVFESHDDRAQGKSDDVWADFSGKCINGADFYRADLRGARMSKWMGGINLTEADLAGADFRDATLSEATLRLADLRDADLQGAQLAETNLAQADLRGASLSGVNLRDALLFLGDPETATPYDPDAVVNLATGANTGAIVADVDFSRVENIGAGQRSYLCRSAAVGLDCDTPQQ